MLVLIEKYLQLPQNKLLEAKGFVYDCNRINGFESQLYWECIQNRANGLPCDFLYHHENKLIAITSIYHFNERETEIDILIHPSITNEYNALFDYIFADLLLEIKKQPIYSMIFRFHRLNSRLKRCLQNLDAVYKYSDYVLNLTAAPVCVSERLKYYVATANDIENIFTLQSKSFADTPYIYKNRLAGNLYDSRRKIYLFYDTNSNNLIGKVHVRKDEHTSVIHDFCVLPEEQSKSYGTEIL
jgi:hypothetical protein